MCSQGLSGLDQYFAMARGTPDAPALDMSKFFDTNYHYIVPELDGDFTAKPNFSMLLDKLARGQALLGKETAVPMIIGGFLVCCNSKLRL
jgi:5-methyltetrahydropteroyltriglutamate--homocysteine methyltransferase